MITRKLPAPSVWLASTNSCSLSLSICARAMRLMPIQSVSINAIVMVVNPGFKTSIRSVTITRVGMPLMISAMRCIIASTLPPK